MTRATRCLVIATALFALVPTARAASIPDWARSIADAAPELGEPNPKYPVRVLLRERRVVVDSDGELRTRVRVAKQVLSARNDGDSTIGIGWFPFREGSRMKASRAWHLPPGEKAERASGLQQVDVALGDSFLSDSKVRVVALQNLRRGSLVFFEFEAVETPHTLSLDDEIDRDAPVAIARFVLELPDKWSVLTSWQRFAGPAPAVGNNVYTWEVKDLPPVDEEPLAVPRSDLAPRLVLALQPPAGSKTPVSFANWAALGSWYEELVRARIKVQPELEAEARRLAPADAPWLDVVRQTAHFVRDRVRYVAREIGIGGYQAHYASETYAKLLGDCKDKATLLVTLLTARSIRAYPVLVNLGELGTVADGVPSVAAFNHVIVAVPIPAGTTLSADFGGAQVDGGELGPLLFVDTTAESVAFGTLEAALAGHRAVVVAGAKTALVTIPIPPPAVNRIERDVGIKGHGGSAAEFLMSTRFYGEHASEQRSAWRASARDYRAEVEASVRREFVDATAIDLTVAEEADDGAFVETLRWTAPLPPGSGSARSLMVYPGAQTLLPRVALSRRKTGVRFPIPSLLRVETTIEGLAPAGPLPAPQQLAGERWQIETTVAATHATWALELKQREFPLESIGDLKKLYSAITGTAGTLLEVR